MASEDDDTPGNLGVDPGADFDKLARRYLDLWQSQLAGLAADQTVTEQIARLFAAANTQVASAMQAAQGAPYAATAPPSTPSSAANGTSPSAASSGHSPDDVGELRKRLEALEARLADLEARLRRT